jgi:hypothetical protein
VGTGGGVSTSDGVRRGGRQPHCFACTLAHGRPQQLWRYSAMIRKAAEHVDVFIAGSRFSEHPWSGCLPLGRGPRLRGGAMPGPLDEPRAVAALDELPNDSPRLREGPKAMEIEALLGAAIWQRAGTLQIRRQWPVATKAGKILPLHLIKAE